MNTFGFTRNLLCAGWLLLCGGAFASGVEVWLSPAGPANPTAAGTPSNPYRCPDGASLQTVLSSLPANSTLHFMPGTFLVNKWIDPKSGWKLRGAGMDVTVLRLSTIEAAPPGGKVAVIGGLSAFDTHDHVEVSDMTIDCNLQNQHLPLAAQAVNLSGNNVRISRVHAINWGSTLKSDECFVLNINSHPEEGIKTNCVIDDCVVDTPGPVLHADGTTAISIFTGAEEVPGYSLLRGGEIRGNLVCGIAAGGATPGHPAYLNAYSAGPFEVYVHDNRAIDLPGGIGFYQDTWSGQDLIVAGNLFENIRLGIYFNLTAYHMSGIQLLDNIILPAEGGAGIEFYGGYPPGRPEAYVKDLIIKGNTIHPCRGTTNITALVFDGVITATVVNNIFDGGQSGNDLAVPWSELPGLKLNTFAGNYNLQGTALRMRWDADHDWRPDYEDLIRFLPARGTPGWYRILDASSWSSGDVEVYAPLQRGKDNVQTDVAFSYRVRSYTTSSNELGDISLERQGSYNGGAVTRARIGNTWDGTNALVYLDIYVSKTDDPKPITVRIRGMNNRHLHAAPERITRPPRVFRERGL